MKKFILLGAFLVAGTTMNFAKSTELPVINNEVETVVSKTVDNLPYQLVTYTHTVTYSFLGVTYSTTTETYTKLVYVK